MAEPHRGRQMGGDPAPPFLLSGGGPFDLWAPGVKSDATPRRLRGGDPDGVVHAEAMYKLLHMRVVPELRTHAHELAAGDAWSEAEWAETDRRIHLGEYGTVDRF